MEGILTRPRCPACGFQVENDCPVGAGCPGCGKRLGLEGLSDVERTELVRLHRENGELRNELAGLRSALEVLQRENAVLKTPAPTPTPTEGEGGGDGS